MLAPRRLFLSGRAPVEPTAVRLSVRVVGVGQQANGIPGAPRCPDIDEGFNQSLTNRR
jgi:hypothetical protein